MKKPLLAIAAAALLVTLVGCSSDEPESSATTVVVPTGGPAGSVVLKPTGENEAFCKQMFAVGAALRSSGNGDPATFTLFKAELAKLPTSSPPADIEADIEVVATSGAAAGAVTEVIANRDPQVRDASNRINDWAVANCGADPRQG